MSVLILKLNATGDVVRTTTLLRRIEGPITWVTARGNLPLLKGVSSGIRCFSWEQRELALDERYDQLINLEDDIEVSKFAKNAVHKALFGAYTSDGVNVTYSENARRWFDMSLISVFGRRKADDLKFQNRSSYQELIFSGLGFDFRGEPYSLPEATPTGLNGDVAMAPVAGAVWPMKNWAYYPKLKTELERLGYRVNILPKRSTLLEHLGDIQGHRCLVGGDSLPMHLALGSGIRCVTIFNCTSPWEIFGYGLQTKVVSPRLGDFFYKRDFDEAATTAIPVATVLEAVLASLRDEQRAAD